MKHPAAIRGSGHFSLLSELLGELLVSAIFSIVAIVFRLFLLAIFSIKSIIFEHCHSLSPEIVTFVIGLPIAFWLLCHWGLIGGNRN
jgi:hypothetical protein